LHAYADLFCEVYDALDEDETREHAGEWLTDGSFNSLAASFETDVARGRTADAMRVRMTNTPGLLPTQPGGDVLDRRRLACLVGLDRAFAHLNPTLRPHERTPDALVPLAAYVQVRGRLDSGAQGGALLLRIVRHAAPEGNVTSKRELFANVVRVPEQSWGRCELVRVGEEAAILPHEVADGLRIGCVPVIANPSELLFRVRRAGGRRYYRICPADRPVTRRRIPEIVRCLDDAGVIIGVAPEQTLSRTLLRVWQRTLLSPDRVPSRLRMILVGTGSFRLGFGRASNTAVLLDGRTGAVIARQNKMFPFDFSAQELARWKLESRLGSNPVAEDLVHGRRLTLLDAGSTRIAILICEDLAKLLDVAPLVRDLGVSHLLTPVFSRPIRERRWEQSAGAVHVRETGATIVVSNSLVMSEITGTSAGTSLVLAPGQDEVLVGRSEQPAMPTCFTLLADGTAKME
jgi:predicted amidohydrolase